MKTTTNYGLKKPEGNEYISIDDLNYNADLIDEELKKRAKSSGGDISNTIVQSFGTCEEEFPIPEPGEETKTLWGKVKKFVGDMKDWIEAYENEIEITLLAAGWSGSAPYTQTVDVPGIKATDKVRLMSAVKKDTPAETAKTWEKMAGMIKAGEALDGQAVFYCPSKKPTEDFNVKLVGVSVNE